MIAITPSPTVEASSPAARFDGLELSDSEWRLDPDRYRRFVDALTGIEPSAELSPADCYRIGARLEGFIEQHRRRDEWAPTLVESYPEVDSLEEIVWLARFFRECHDCRVATAEC